MYKHNPLPFDISKYKNRSKQSLKRSIVFSSPKLSRFLHKTSSNQKNNKAKSESKQKSIHRIDSKQKPKLLTTIGQHKSFQHSTAEPYQSLNISPMKIKQQSFSPSYFNVGSLLKSKQTADSSLKESFKKSTVISTDTKIQRLSNNRKKQKGIVQSKKNIDGLQNIEFFIRQQIQQKTWQIYEGQTQNNEFHGYGSLYFSNGDKLMGFFYHNQPEGHGSYYKNNTNCVINGIWSQGKLVQII